MPSKAAPERVPRLTRTQIEALILEVLGFHADRAVVAAMIPRLIAIAVAGADYTAQVLAASNLIGSRDRVVQALLAAREGLLTGINGTTRYRLRVALLRALDNDATPRELQQAVMDVFGTAEGFRSSSIALTEGGMYWETGAYREMQDLGGLVRDWVTQRDSKVRDSHVPMDGQCRPLDVAFTSGDGFPLLYPRDPDGEIQEIANCRCFCAPIAGRCEGRGLRLSTEAQRLAYWKATNAAMWAAVRPLRATMRTIFRAQRTAVLEHLNRLLAA